MRKTLIMFIAGALLFTAFLGTANGASEITKTDPTDDLFTSGTVGDEAANVDFVQLGITYDPFPALVSMKVDGVIGTGASPVYTYMVLIDSTGDGEADIMVTYNTQSNQASIIYGEAGMGILESSLVTIENEDTLKMELSGDYFSSGTVYDIGASSTMIGESSMASDEIELDVMGDDDDIDDDITDDDIDDDITDDDIDDDEWPDDDDSGPVTDPRTETPTDNSISVEIEDVSFDYDVTEEHMTIEVKITGTTSGNVDHCSNLMITYDENGDPEDLDDNEWEEGPDGFDRMTMFGYTMEQHFRGTGDGGEDDWSKWEFYVYMDGPFDENMSMVDEDELEEGKSAVFFVRAFSDEAETMWNQDEKDVTDEITGAMTGGDDDDSPIGAALIILGFIAAAGVITVFSGRRK